MITNIIAEIYRLSDTYTLKTLLEQALKISKVTSKCQMRAFNLVKSKKGYSVCKLLFDFTLQCWFWKSMSIMTCIRFDTLTHLTKLFIKALNKFFFKFTVKYTMKIYNGHSYNNVKVCSRLTPPYGLEIGVRQ